MTRALVVLLLLVVVIVLPFAMRPKKSLLADAQDTLVVITPHNEAIRSEFSRAFAAWHLARTGRTVRVDWRMPGGASEIARYLKGEFFAAFGAYWQRLGHPWSAEAQAAFDNPSVSLPGEPAHDTPAQAARRAFFGSDTGIGADVLFGGGAYDFSAQASAGRLVDSGVLRRHPEWFGEQGIPPEVSGETFFDPAGRWTGAAISSFGICYNTDVIRELGISPPAGWDDLGNPQFLNRIALADPTKSGSAAKAFEMILQQQMQERLRDSRTGDERSSVAEGWKAGLRLIQRVAANARYFTDSATNVPVDVAQGDAAAGMCIDFYGRAQSEAVQKADSSRLHYFTPQAGSSVGVDPIGILRGAPHRKLAESFVDFVLSKEGQKLWNFRPGTPGGPVHYALRRLPIRKELYADEYAPFRSDPGVFPYEDARGFVYHPGWTAPLFKTLGFVIRVAFLDPHDELVGAWKALMAAGFPPLATARFSDLSAVDYEAANETIRPALADANRLVEVRLAKQLSDHFRRQYLEAQELAQQGK